MPKKKGQLIKRIYPLWLIYLSILITKTLYIIGRHEILIFNNYEVIRVISELTQMITLTMTNFFNQSEMTFGMYACIHIKFSS